MSLCSCQFFSLTGLSILLVWLLVSLLLVGRLAETLGGWAPLCTRGPRVSFSTCLSMWPRQQGRWASSVAAQSSQECKAVVARPSYDLTAELSSITSTALCWLEQVTGPTQIQEEGTPPGMKWRCCWLGVPSVTVRTSTEEQNCC